MENDIIWSPHINKSYYLKKRENFQVLGHGSENKNYVQESTENIFMVKCSLSFISIFNYIAYMFFPRP